MYKAGDKFEVVGNRGGEDHVKIGDIVMLIENNSDHSGRFTYPDGTVFLAGFCAQDGMTRTVRPLRTEAEKRGAKFGVTGVAKRTKRKISFVSDSLKKNALGVSVWCVCFEDGEVGYFHPSNIRLDHEPEYKEIPFSEATHEQRMDAGNLWYGGSPVVQIRHFAGSGYAFTYKGSFDICTDTNNLTIRIPT